MAAIKRQQARKEYVCSKCGEKINVGDTYLKGSPFRQRPIIRCLKCGLEGYELSTSEYVRDIGCIIEKWQETFGINDSTCDDISLNLEDIKCDLEERLENIPEQLRESAGETLQNRIDCIEDTINELSQISYDDMREEAVSEAETVVSEEDYVDDEEGLKEALDEEATSIFEQNFCEAVDEALGCLDY